MRPSLVLRAKPARTPLIKFLGKRHHPAQVDHTPQPHPASPTHSLPESFASYRQKAQQHGPLGGGQQASSSSSSSSDIASGTGAVVPRSAHAYGAIGGSTGHKLGPVAPKDGEFFDRSELPKRFQRLAWSDEEMDAITSGGASMWS